MNLQWGLVSSENVFPVAEQFKASLLARGSLALTFYCRFAHHRDGHAYASTNAGICANALTYRQRKTGARVCESTCAKCTLRLWLYCVSMLILLGSFRNWIPIFLSWNYLDLFQKLFSASCGCNAFDTWMWKLGCPSSQISASMCRPIKLICPQPSESVVQANFTSTLCNGTFSSTSKISNVSSRVQPWQASCSLAITK